MEKTKKWVSENVVIVTLVVLCILFGIGNPVFFSVKNILNLLSQMCINALMATGLVYVIILGGIDISVGGTAALAGVISAYVGLMFPNMNIFTSIIILVVSALAVGIVVGFLNGFMIAYLNVVPMICTLAMLNITRGLAYVITGGQPVYGLPDAYAFLGASRLIKTEAMPNGIIPAITIFTVIVVALMHILLSKTVFGRHVYAVGSNKSVAHLSGINVKKVTLTGHVICSIMACLAGVCAASKIQNGQPGACDAYEMFAIASAVMGGTSLVGGSGSVGRAMFGVAVIAVIKNGMDLMQISSYWQKVVIGVIILLAVIMDMAQKNKKD
ncbi:MAG: ABC transporter permease [Eubacteriales bacterium]|nr:ABC transporter permease [Eubacteriales bacterium]